MKKLTKKSLEELAQVMPVLSEVEMRECVGGDIVYINADGVFLRKENNPTVNEVRIEGTSFYKTLPEGTYVQTFMTTTKPKEKVEPWNDDREAA